MSLSHSPLHSAVMYPWNKRTLFIGTLIEPIAVSYGAATLIVSLGNPVHIATRSGIHACYSALIPAGLSVKIDARHQPLAICHLDVLGEDFARLDGCLKSTEENLRIGLKDEADARLTLQTMYRQPSDSEKAFGQLDHLLDYCFDRFGAPSPAIDTRIIHAINYIKQHFESNIPIGDVAGSVQLSVPRLIQLFKQQTGVPIRRFRLWHRMYESMLPIGAGHNLTDAALIVGFSDSPHFTHVFSSIWGVTPSCLFGKGIGADIISPTPVLR